jgi:hypothetical protein
MAGASPKKKAILNNSTLVLFWEGIKSHSGGMDPDAAGGAMDIAVSG